MSVVSSYTGIDDSITDGSRKKVEPWSAVVIQIKEGYD